MHFLRRKRREIKLLWTFINFVRERRKGNSSLLWILMNLVIITLFGICLLLRNYCERSRRKKNTRKAHSNIICIILILSPLSYPFFAFLFASPFLSLPCFFKRRLKQSSNLLYSPHSHSIPLFCLISQQTFSRKHYVNFLLLHSYKWSARLQRLQQCPGMYKSNK